MLNQTLKELRKKNKITQEQLAQIIGVERSSIGKYESPTKPVIPSSDILMRMAEYFNVSIDYLMGRENETLQPEKKQTKEEKDIEKIIDNAINSLSGTDGLMFDGEVPATEEEIEQLKNLMRIGVAAAKQRAKEKFTPKKYRK